MTMEILSIRTTFPLTSLESVIVYSINYTLTKMLCGNNVCHVGIDCLR